MSASQTQSDWVTRVLGVSPGSQQQDLPHDQRRWAAVKAIWFGASNAVDAQIAALQAALRDSGDPEYQEIAELGLNGVTGTFKVPLLAAMQDIDRAGGQPDAGLIGKLRQVIAGFLDHLTSDPRVDAVDDNDLGVPVHVADTLIPALEELDAALAGWARG